MKRIISFVLALTLTLPLAACSSGTSKPSMQTGLTPTDIAISLGINSDNYPRINGSTSTFPLVQLLYRNMFQPNDDGEGNPIYPGMPQEPSKTVPSYQALIDGEVDLIIVPDPSTEVREMVKDAGVELEYVRIGAEGLVFITHKDNPAKNITQEQAISIYCDETITNWKELGGADGRIVPICRNADSGSQAQFDNLILKGKPVAASIQENYIARDMNNIIEMVDDYQYFARDGETTAYALGYSLYYFIQRVDKISGVNSKALAYNGVLPTSETILSGEYPLAMSYYAVYRKDAAEENKSKTIADWLINDFQGQLLVYTSGLGALKSIFEGSTGEENETSNQPTATPTATPTVQDFVDALNENDIETAKKAAEQYYEDMPNQETLLGVISITFDSEIKHRDFWEPYGEGLGGDPNQPKFLPGNLAVFNVNTKRYGDGDGIILGRKGSDFEWMVVTSGR